ncbi:MAG: YcxB family protein [Pseudomonadota bacterium]
MVTAVAAMIALAFAFDGWDAVLPVSIGGLIGAGLMLGLARFVFVPRYAKRAWRDFALIKEPVELTLSAEGFGMVQPSAHVDAKWEQIIAWDEDSKVFALYVTRQQAYILPKSQLSVGHIDFSRSCLIKSGLIKKGTKRK